MHSTLWTPQDILYHIVLYHIGTVGAGSCLYAHIYARFEGLNNFGRTQMPS